MSMFRTHGEAHTYNNASLWHYQTKQHEDCTVVPRKPWVGVFLEEFKNVSKAWLCQTKVELKTNGS